VQFCCLFVFDLQTKRACDPLLPCIFSCYYVNKAKVDFTTEDEKTYLDPNCDSCLSDDGKGTGTFLNNADAYLALEMKTCYDDDGFEFTVESVRFYFAVPRPIPCLNSHAQLRLTCCAPIKRSMSRSKVVLVAPQSPSAPTTATVGSPPRDVEMLYRECTKGRRASAAYANAMKH